MSHPGIQVSFANLLKILHKVPLSGHDRLPHWIFADPWAISNVFICLQKRIWSFWTIFGPEKKYTNQYHQIHCKSMKICLAKLQRSSLGASGGSTLTKFWQPYTWYLSQVKIDLPIVFSWPMGYIKCIHMSPKPFSDHFEQILGPKKMHKVPPWIFQRTNSRDIYQLGITV